MTDLQTLVLQTSNPSLLKIQQRLHDEVIKLGKLAIEWKEKHDELLVQQLETGSGYSPRKCIDCAFYERDVDIEPCASCVHGGNVGDNFKKAKGKQ